MGGSHWPLYHCRCGIWELPTGPCTTVGVVYMGAFHWPLHYCRRGIEELSTGPYHCRGGIYGSLPVALIPLQGGGVYMGASHWPLPL